MNHTNHNFILGIWLMFCAAVVFIMVVVGGVTRLTQSGLSMVEWAPLMGILPPIGEQQWLAVFEKYKAYPEYQLVNAGMSLDDFKSIFWWEYGHRVLGRFIGLIYLIPLLYFVFKGIVQKRWYAKLFFLFILGGLQGLMGWYMVKSGLVDVPHVSQYRLTAHLGLAIIIFAFMFWYALDFLRTDSKSNHASGAYRRATLMTCIVVFIMILSGGFVAGTKAGFIMNTFPTMNGEWVPTGVMAMLPWWKNLFENAVTIQFVHRCFALLVMLAVVFLVVKSQSERFKTFTGWVLFAMILQITLGISALLMKVPVVLGAAHQAGAVILLASCLHAMHVAHKSNRFD